MTELESLRAERELTIRAYNMRVEKHAEWLQHTDARIAELEREPQRWRPKDNGKWWYVQANGEALSNPCFSPPGCSANAFPTEARAQEVATHFRRLGLAAQWGALLTDEAYNEAFRGMGTYPARGTTWRFVFPTAAQRDGFMADAKEGGLL